MFATATVRIVFEAIAATILNEIVNLALARQWCGRCPAKEPLKELDPLEDPVRPFVD